MSSQTITIVYNADGTIWGKMRYGFNKLWTQNPRASCSACELTHGGLRLSANEGWEGYRRDLEKRGFIVQMRHRDEIPAQLLSRLKAEGTHLPCILGDVANSTGNPTVLVNREQLDQCNGDLQKLDAVLMQKLQEN